MNLLIFDNVIKDADQYVKEIFDQGFDEFQDGDNVFKGVKQRPNDDDFASFVLDMLPGYEISLNLVRHSPFGQIEPNYIHKDDMMGDITAILYLTKNPPYKDGTIFWEEDIDKEMCIVKSKFNRMIAFDSDCRHSRSMFMNFGSGVDARLIQVVFLKQKA